MKQWLNIQIEDDLRNGISRAVPVPPNEASKEEIINALVANVESMIKADRKITSLKQLQVPVHVHILHHFCMCILVTSALAQFLWLAEFRVISGGLDLKRKNCKGLSLRMFLRR
jgi:hypothetical protein